MPISEQYHFLRAFITIKTFNYKKILASPKLLNMEIQIIFAPDMSYTPKIFLFRGNTISGDSNDFGWQDKYSLLLKADKKGIAD